MSLLTLDVGGPDELVLEVLQQAGHAAPRTVGSRVYGFLGNERTLIQAELLVVAVVLMNTEPITIRAVRRIFARGAQVDCAGDVFLNGGATITCSGEITDEMEVGTDDGYWIATLTLSEVGDL